MWVGVGAFATSCAAGMDYAGSQRHCAKAVSLGRVAVLPTSGLPPNYFPRTRLSGSRAPDKDQCVVDVGGYA